MAKHRKDFNNEPFDPYVDPQTKADDFDKQYEQNRDSGNAKEVTGQPRPEAEGRKTWRADGR